MGVSSDLTHKSYEYFLEPNNYFIFKVINSSGVYYIFFSERLKMDNSVTQDEDGGKGHYIDNNMFSMARL